MTPREALQTFQDNVQRLRQHAFTRRVGKTKFSYGWRAIKKGTIRDVVQPSENDIAGYAALLRGFMTNDDPWSLAKLPQIYRALGASRFQEKKLSEYRKRIAQWLKWHCGVTPREKILANGDVLEIFIYGRVLHQTKKREFDEIVADQISKDMFMHAVCNCLVTYSGAMLAVSVRNQIVLDSTSGRSVLPLP